jgi:hypothetical protein
MEHLAGKRHADDEDLQHAVVDWLNSQVAVWYEEGISKLVSRYDECLNVEYILLGVTPASELSESTFRNLVSVPSSWTTH